MGIKLEIVGEKSEPEKTVKLEFRKSKLSETTRNEDVAFLIAKGAGNLGSDIFAVRIDGPKKKFYVRKSQIEALGFQVVIE